MSLLWVLKQFTQSLPSRYVVSSFEKYPPKYPLGIFWTRPLSSFQKNPSNYPASTFWTNSPSSFKKYPSIWSKCTQPYTWQVLCEFVVKLDHIESSLWVLWKEPARYILIKLMGTFWKNLESLFKKYPLGNLMGSFEMNSGVSFKKYPVGTLVGTFWKNSPHTCWVTTGWIASKLTTNSQCTHWVNDPSPPVQGGGAAQEICSRGELPHWCNSRLDCDRRRRSYSLPPNRAVTPVGYVPWVIRTHYDLLKPAQPNRRSSILSKNETNSCAPILLRDIGARSVFLALSRVCRCRVRRLIVGLLIKCHLTFGSLVC